MLFGRTWMARACLAGCLASSHMWSDSCAVGSRLAELDKRQEKLQAQISQLHGEDKARQLAHQRLLRSPSRTPHNERKSHPPFPLMRRIAITTFMSKLALEFIKSKGFTKPLTAASLMDM